MRVILQHQTLATDMQAEYKQWDDFCMDLEDNVSIDAREARQKTKTKQEFSYTKVDDDDTKRKGKGKARDPTLYGPRATAHSSTDDFGDLRNYGHVVPRAPTTVWGYRKFDAPAISRAKTHFSRHLTSLPEDPDETEDEAEEASTERGLGSPMELSDHTDGVEEVMNFEEAFGADDDDDVGDEEEEEDPDQEMQDAGEENVEDKGLGDDNQHDHDGDDCDDDGDGDGGKGEGEGKKGLMSSGGKVLGLYGEEL